MNAWVIYNNYFSVGKKLSITDFKERIATQLITGKDGLQVTSGARHAVVGGKLKEHTLVEASGPSSKCCKRSRECYKTLSVNEGSEIARKKCCRVTTYCGDCEEKPFLCVTCFGINHSV